MTHRNALSASSADSAGEPVLSLAHRVADVLQTMLDEGHDPRLVADAAFIGTLPILLETTRSPNVEALLLNMAARFHKDQVLTVKEMN